MFNTRRAAVIRHDDRWLAVVGIPLADQTRRAEAEGRRRREGPTEVPFQVTDKSYRTQHLTIKNSGR